MLTFRFENGSFDEAEGLRGSAENEAAKTEASSLRWRVRIGVKLGVKVLRLVTVVEPLCELVEMRNRGLEV